MSGGGHGHEGGSFFPDIEAYEHVKQILAVWIYAGVDALFGWLFPGTHSMAEAGGGGGHH